MTAVARVYHGAHAAIGPLVYVARTAHAALGEWVTLRTERALLRGQVIDVGAEVTVVQVLDDTVGLSPASARVTFTGELPRVAVGKDLLGRVVSGAGDPRDGLPPPVGEALRPLWGAPINPVRRLPPHDFIETGISAIDGMNTLVRGQKLPVFSGPGLPALELAAEESWRGRAHRAASPSRWSSWRSESPTGRRARSSTGWRAAPHSPEASSSSIRPATRPSSASSRRASASRAPSTSRSATGSTSSW